MANAMITTRAMPMLNMSITLSLIGPMIWMRGAPAPGNCSVPPPMKYWKTYRRARERPMLTIMSCTTPDAFSPEWSPEADIHHEPEDGAEDDRDEDREPDRQREGHPEEERP